MDAMSRTQTEVKVAYAGHICAWFCFLFIAQKMKLHRQHDVSTGIFVAFCIVAALAILDGFVMRKKFFKLATEALPQDSRKANGFRRSANFLGFSCAIIPAILGAVLKFLVSGWLVPGILFGLSLGFLLLWRPTDPPMRDQPR